MNFFELFLLTVALSMDAFAAAVCKGLKMPRLDLKRAFVVGLFFGGFQAAMPAVGWLLGNGFKGSIQSIDHWVAFFLLAFIGLKMIYDVFFSGADEAGGGFSLKELLLLAVATSIDALAVGITFSFLRVNILSAVFTIGLVTFLLSLLGVVIGHKFGALYQRKAQTFGGIILVAIGLKILLEHLGVINF